LVEIPEDEAVEIFIREKVLFDFRKW